MSPLSATPPIQIMVITAGLSQPSSSRLLGDRLASATTSALVAGGDRVEVEIVELREWARQLTNNLLTGFPDEPLRGVLARVGRADGVIAVSPIFSASYSGLFKTFFDILDPEALLGKPVVVAATGGSARHSLALEHALRPLMSYLRATVTSTAVYAAPEDWSSEGELTSRINRAAAELAALIRLGSQATAPPQVESAQADGDVIPFTRLLAAQRSAAVQQLR